MLARESGTTPGAETRSMSRKAFWIAVSMPSASRSTLTKPTMSMSSLSHCRMVRPSMLAGSMGTRSMSGPSLIVKPPTWMLMWRGRPSSVA